MSLDMTIYNPTIPMRSFNNLPLESPKMIRLQITLVLYEVYSDMKNQETHGRFLLREPRRSRATAVRRFSFLNRPPVRNEITDAAPDQHVSCGFRYRAVDFDRGVGIAGQQLQKRTRTFVGAAVREFGERLESLCRRAKMIGWPVPTCKES
jgi:hypothetical protein